jgi:hypothetical protein
VTVPHDVAQLRGRHRERVIGNLVKPAERWQQRCHAYNVHIEPCAAAREDLGLVQDALLSVEPGLVRCPPATLHISVAWLLAVHVTYDDSKHSLWDQHGQTWTSQLAVIAAEHSPFQLRYRWLVVTDTAVIALADPVQPVRRLRDDIAARLRLPAQIFNSAAIVHSTLFRFRSSLVSPNTLLESAEAIELDSPTTVGELTISEELVFPSLLTSTKARLPLRGAANPV